MTETYFLGREQDGDESGVYPEDVFDGKIWCVDPDEPDPSPVIVAHVSEEDAEWVLKVIQDRATLLAACDALWAEKDAQQSDQAACRRLYNAWQQMNEARCKAKGLL